MIFSCAYNITTIMGRTIPTTDLDEIVDIVHGHPPGLNSKQILSALAHPIPSRTLQHRLRLLARTGRLEKSSQGRWTVYKIPIAQANQDRSGTSEYIVQDETQTGSAMPSKKGEVKEKRLARYVRSLLDKYQPGISGYLSKREREHLLRHGKQDGSFKHPGDLAKHILRHLETDLSWNSSRLEGNSYSLRETWRLFRFGVIAAGKSPDESQMIANHRLALRFMIDCADFIDFEASFIFRIHKLLANKLLKNVKAIGRLRDRRVEIGNSVFVPVDNPSVIDECFHLVLSKAKAIKDPFEQALFVMVHLPYLQPFEDVNKRVSRFAANIPMIRANLAPLSFSDVPVKEYVDAVLGVYELNQIDPLKELFISAYERSAHQCLRACNAVDAPPPHRSEHQSEMFVLVKEKETLCLSRTVAVKYIEDWTQIKEFPADQEHFIEEAGDTILLMHEDTYRHSQITDVAYEAWKKVWNDLPAS